MDLSIEHLTHRYSKEKIALQDVNLHLQPGITGLLGPNGAGKSSLIRILATLTRPTRGKLLWNGEDITGRPQVLRSRLGYLPQDFNAYPNLSPLEFLDYVAALKNIPSLKARKQALELLDALNLSSALHRPIGDFSGGMRQRVGIAQALLGEPDLLILDEPTVGLDPEERVRFRQLLLSMAKERIILISTHIVSDLESAARQVILLSAGQVVFQNDTRALQDSMKGKVWQHLVPEAELQHLQRKWVISASVQQADGVLVRMLGTTPPHPDAQPVTPSLEDAYLFHTRKEEVFHAQLAPRLG
ncbi:ABC transporter ATP-binding protein [Deinococcus cellulosilyticus]|uniref:ABC transporter ATP-binding protein n=1 Tax=Deinococcus cellulosilyticus (strain DSM 18568 / NBRC 106333 / KACC 11606 / 5516J-15) TaxID=1223518 RepID=A0A511N2F5_DEIC1|nr:ABC transporter ATP-binding protein [Deinococcus cellulosilyticus]GEM46596.1 ABC transporter ATP-binding protein [Deinococcus cellulosilyticus NBRC 106333 = KACC 11606]